MIHSLHGCVVCGRKFGDDDHHCTRSAVATYERQLRIADKQEESEPTFGERLEQGFELLRAAGDFYEC